MAQTRPNDDPDELYEALTSYLANTPDLMRHLAVGALWEYFIYENELDDERPVLHFYLEKVSDVGLSGGRGDPPGDPDLVLYFTKGAILELIDGHPPAATYYERYREVMRSPRPGVALDNKVNKPRLKLWRLGYKNWQRDFGF
ncbi:MAG: hypothetical protein Kow0069_20550 [Promethearchaeota archaeon]